MANDETPPLFETSSKYTENPAITDEVYAAKQRAKRVVTKHGLPEGFSINHLGIGITKSGKFGSTSFVSMLNDEKGNERGTIKWDPKTGHVGNFDMDEDVRPFASHLLLSAHEYADREGVDGPTNSDNLTAYSYKMAKKLVPSAMSRHTMVEGFSAHYLSEKFSSGLHALKSRAHLIEAQANQLHPSLAHLTPASYHLAEAIAAHTRGNYRELSPCLTAATGATYGLEHEVKNLNHPDAEPFLASLDSLREDIRGARIG